MNRFDSCELQNRSRPTKLGFDPRAFRAMFLEGKPSPDSHPRNPAKGIENKADRCVLLENAPDNLPVPENQRPVGFFDPIPVFFPVERPVPAENGDDPSQAEFVAFGLDFFDIKRAAFRSLTPST